MLFCVSDNGYEKLKTISEDPNYGFTDIKESYNSLRGRIDWLCGFFHSQGEQSNLKKRKSTREGEGSRSSVAKKKKKITLDENGNIVFPVEISTSLRLLSQGKIFIYYF